MWFKCQFWGYNYCQQLKSESSYDHAYSIVNLFHLIQTIYFCFVCQGSDGDVWGDEDVRSHLRETLVAGSVPHRVQDLRQHEASRATDWGKSTSALKPVLEDNKISILESVTSTDIVWIGNSLWCSHNHMVALQYLHAKDGKPWLMLYFVSSHRKRSGWPPPAIMHFMLFVTFSHSTLNLSAMFC